MSEVARHYEQLLGRHYVWMSGLPFADKVAEEQALLRHLGLAPGAYGTAIDLGCGPGFQSIALARLGFARVLAVDTSEALLDELNTHKGGLPVDTIRTDLRRLPDLAKPGSVDAVVCMGDTLTHLETRADVSRLLASAQALLSPGGALVLTFRDLSIEVTGLDRFLPVRADADRIMTCVLEFEPGKVVVTDLVHVRLADGWRLTKSSYRKLRLAPGELVAELQGLGFKVQRSEPAGRLHAIVARR